MTIKHKKVSGGPVNPAVAVDLHDWDDDHTGNLPVSQLNSGTGASASTYWRGDGTWAGFPLARPLLVADTTFYVRPDGTATAPIANTNTAAGAMSTWNLLYAWFAKNTDTGGFNVTLSSGTQNTYTAGLFMDVAWVGGGNLTIEFNGCSMAETATKCIIVNQTMPGRVTIQNAGPSGGPGVGGVFSSTGFAGIQISAPGIVNIGAGMEAGDCFDAAFEATQGGVIAFGSPIRIGGTNASARSLALAGPMGSIGFNAQTVTFLSNKTYTTGTIVAQSGVVYVDAITWTLGGHTVTGPRYFKDPTGYIYTGLAASNYIPGSTPGISTGYDNTAVSSFLNGGAAANSTLTIQSTTNAAPSGDSVTISASSLFFGAGSGTSNITFGIVGFSGASVTYAGSTSGGTILKASAAASGTLTLPAATDTLMGRATTDTPTNKTISATTNTIQLPYCAAELSANQGTTTTTVNKILCNTELADPNSWYDNATNYRWTPQLAGKYKITAAVGVSGTTVTEVDLFIKVNAVTKAQSFILGMNTATAQSATISKIVTLNGTTDFVEMYAAAFGTGTLNFLAAPSTWFEAQYLGA